MKNHLTHIFTADPEATTSQTSDDLISRFAFTEALLRHLAQANNSGCFVSRRAVILGQFGLNDDTGLELVGDDEIRCLIESRKPFGPFRFAESYSSQTKLLLNGRLQAVTDQFTDGVPMAGEWSSEEPLVK